MTNTDHIHDFDFLAGRWTVRNRYLRDRLKGSHDWVEFESIVISRPLLGGVGNEDEYRTPYWPDFVGMAFRFFDRSTHRWAIYWVDSRRGVLEPPVFGSFDGDRGVFCGGDTLDGRAIVVRFTWTRKGPDGARWEQAFSGDGGDTWETNWEMEFVRSQNANDGADHHQLSTSRQ